jgi:hypothetical protein
MLACGHERTPFGSPLCAHLRACRKPWISYIKWYVGSGLAVEMICNPCAEDRERGSSTAAELVCEECFEYATTEVGDVVGMRGKPEIRTRSERFHIELRETVLPRELGTIVDIAPVAPGRASTWLILADDGVIARLDADTGEWSRLATTTVPSEPDHKPWMGHVLRRRLHASANGEFAAVVNDYGRYGQIIDLRSGAVTATLDGGDYHPDTVPFSFTFTQVHGRVVAIHRTAWNRLDLSEASTGALLSDRGPTSYQGGEERPGHYLDYFHGALHVSPSGSKIVDDGWVWHPVGVVTTWDLEVWATNIWESEDGPTKKYLCARDYYWDHAITWLNDTTIAIGGLGDDDKMMTDGARIFDVTLPGEPGDRWRSDWRWAREIASFPGPAGLFFSDGTFLFSSDDIGLSRWDPTDGARTGQLAGFRPTHQHRGAGELVQLVDGALVRWRPTK